MKRNNIKEISFNDRAIRYGIKPPSYTEVQLQKIKQANEQFGVKVLSIQDLGEFKLTPQNVELLHKNIHRENKIILGDYKRYRDETYLKNYIDILSKAGADPELLDRLKEVISRINPTTLEQYPISSLLPPLKDFYITLKRGRDKRGRYISISDQVDTMEEQLEMALDDLEDLGYV